MIASPSGKHGQKRRLRKSLSLLLSAGLSLSGLSALFPAFATSQTYNYTGGPQIYVVPAGVSTVSVVVNGAQGGSPTGGGTGGKGATVQAEISVTPGEVLMLNVGGNGTINRGWNGGGRGAGTGGGASDIRRPASGFSTATSCAYNLTCALSDRIVVAGGGGGGGWATTVPGGAAGGDAGQVANSGVANNLAGGDAISGGGASTSAGIAGSGSFSSSGQQAATGSLGFGAESAWVAGATGGGGGGGYYGGGSGGVSQDSTPQADGVAGGGGGSSWASGTGVLSASFQSGTTVGDGSISIDPPSAIPTAAFGFTGAAQFYNVAADVNELAIRIYGAGGGASGDIVFGRLPVSASSVVQVNIGGRGYGNASDYPGRVNGEGGWNGGGSGEYSSAYNSGGGGGGATDIRICADAQNQVCTLSDRVVVAGGGGGGSNGAWGLAGGRGGAGASGEGGDGSGNGNQGFGASLTAGGLIGGTGAATVGALGQGGQSGSAFYGTGGGGGGLYGGGGGNGSGGGGGSSCASATGPCTSATNELGAANARFAHTQGVNGSLSDGLAVITAMPRAITGAITNLSSTTASISGTVNPKHLASAPKLFIGTNQSTIEACSNPSSNCTPANTVLSNSASETVLAGNNPQSVHGAITGLSSNTQYFYRVCAQSVAGYACGETLSFTTALSVVTTAIPTASTQTAVSTQLQASGGSGSYSSWVLTSSSQLPAGLTLDTSSGIVSGVATLTGSGSFTVQVTDSSGGIATGVVSFNFTSPPPPPPAPAPQPTQTSTPTSPPTPTASAPMTISSQASVIISGSESRTVSISGQGLSNATPSLLGSSISLIVTNATHSSLAFVIPNSLAAGRYTLVVRVESQTIQLVDFIEVRPRVRQPKLHRLIIDNFAPGSAKLTRPQMLLIRKFASNVVDPVSAACTGFTMGPRVIATDMKLARERARNTCLFLRGELRTSVSVHHFGKTELLVGNSVRRAEILIRAIDQ